MKKTYLWIIPLLALSACTNNNTEPKASPSGSAPSVKVVQSSESVSLQPQTENKVESSSITTADESFKYAVNLDEFEHELVLNGSVVKKTYNEAFIAAITGVPTHININTKDLNPFGMGIYIDSGDVMNFYPISIKNVPTKEISVIGEDNITRKVYVNTEITVQKTHDDRDDLQIVGEKFYLFYNKNGTISSATKHLTDSNADEMVEYILAEPQEDVSHENKYYELIKAAWQKQQAYIDSLEDATAKESVQTAHAAAIAEATQLTINYPKDEALINAALESVLAGE